MEIILLERIDNLGQMGDLVKVRPGYARNFLLPQGKALRATKANRERFESEKAQREADNLSRRQEAEKIAALMGDLSVSLVRAASEMGQLYGSASARDIASAITDAGYTVSRTQIDMQTALKTLGLFPVRVILHPEVSIEVTVNIARSADEAVEQLRLGRAIVSDIAERERLEAAEAAQAAERQQEALDAEGFDESGGEDQAASADADAAERAEKPEDAGKPEGDESPVEESPVKESEAAAVAEASADEAPADKPSAKKPKAGKAEPKATKAKSAKKADTEES